MPAAAGTIHTPTLTGMTALAVLLAAAVLGGHVARWLHAPRLIGFIVAGILLKQTLGRYEAEPARQVLTELGGVIQDLALALALFLIGEVFELRRLRALRRSLLRVSLWEIAATFGLTALGCAGAAWTFPGMDLRQGLAVGLLLGAVAVATAPAATWLVMREYESKGPTTNHLLGLVGLNNLASIVGFGALFLLLARAGWLPGAAAGGDLWLGLFAGTLGSLLLGLLLGLALSLLQSRLSLTEMVLIFFALLFAMAVGDDWLRARYGVAFNGLVVALAMGAVFANLALDTTRFEHALELVSAPLFALFFVLAGHELRLEALPHLGLFGLVYVGLRAFGKYLGVRGAVRRLGPEARLSRHAGLGLICQAGVAIGLGRFLVEHWPNELAREMNTVILAAVALYELTGPFLVKRAVVAAGEVKLITLLGPGGTRAEAGEARFGLGAWLRWLAGKFLSRPGGATAGGGRGGGATTAGHLMRTNVRFLPATASVEDALHFIERSHLHDFPVADAEGRYVGMVRFGTLRGLMYDPAFADLVSAGDLADPSIPAVTRETPLGELLDLFNLYNLGAAPVVAGRESNRLIGLVEQRDLLRALHRLGPAELAAAAGAEAPVRPPPEALDSSGNIPVARPPPPSAPPEA